jgi:hypothetical protein
MSGDDFRTRLAIEQRALQQRISKLIDFLGDPATDVEALMDIDLLRSQYNAMSVYNDILCKRMLALGIKRLPIAVKS